MAAPSPAARPAAPLPKPDAFEQLFSMLLDKRVRTIKAPSPLMPSGACGVATYVDAAGTPLFAALVDVSFIAGLGAGLAMFPPVVAQDAKKSGKPTDALVENAYEVLNVAASLFNEAEGAATHVKLASFSLDKNDKAKWPPTLATSKSKLALDASVPGYCDGKITVVAL